MQVTTEFNSKRPRYPEFKDQVAVVTGSSRSIGKGIALRLAGEGMKIVIHGLDAQEVESTTQELQALGIPTIGLTGDFTNEDEISRVFQAALDAFGTVYLLVNNAADMRRKPLFEADQKMLDHQLAMNIRAPYLCAQRAAEIMRPAKNRATSSISVQWVGCVPIGQDILAISPKAQWMP